MTKKIGQTTTASVGAVNAGEWTINGTTVTINEDGTVTAGNGAEASITVDEDGTVTITIGSETYTATTDSTGKISSLTGEDGKEVETSAKLTATESTAKGTYTYTDDDGKHTIIAVGGKIVDVTAGTDKGEQVGTYTITDGAVTGTFGTDSFTAATDKDGYIESIIIGEATIELTRTSGNTAYTLKASESQSEGDGEEQETPAVDTTVYFTEFLASDLVSAGDISLEKDGEKTDTDKTWILTTSAKGTVKTGAVDIKTYDYDGAGAGYKYTARLNPNGTGRSLKLLIGKGKTKVIRIDAGTSKGNISDSSESAEITAGSNDKWTFKLAGSTKYFSVTGGNDGYVTIALGTNKTNIYGIHVVDGDVIDTSDKERTYSTITVSDPVITFSGTAGDGDNADKFKVSTELTANVAAPTYTVTTYTAKADGVEAASKTTSEATAVESPQWTYAWSKTGDAEFAASTAAITPTASGTYTVKAKYSATVNGTAKTSAEKSNTAVVFNPSAATVKVTFAAGEGSFAEDTTTEYTIESGTSLAANNITAPTPVAPEEKQFDAWSPALSTTAEISQDTTYTATYKEKTFEPVLIGWKAGTEVTISNDNKFKLGDVDCIAAGGISYSTDGNLVLSGNRFNIGATALGTGNLPAVEGYKLVLTVTASLKNTDKSNVKGFQYGIDLDGTSKLTAWLDKNTEYTDKNSKVKASIEVPSATYTAENTATSGDTHFFNVRAESNLVVTITAIKLEYVEVTGNN